MMDTRAAKTDKLVTTLVTNTSRVLMVIAFVFTVALTGLTAVFYDTLQKEAKTVRASDLQVLRQANSEMLKLQRTIEKYQNERVTLDDLYLYFDIVYSRAKLLEGGRALKSFPELLSQVISLVQRIYEADAILSNVETPNSSYVNDFRIEIKAIQKEWESLALFVFQKTIDHGTAEKQQQIQLAIWMGGCLLALGLSVLSLLGILFREMNFRRQALARERHLTTQLVATTKAVESANHAKSSFLQTMSHELRTPLNAISGFSQVLAATELNEKQTEYLNYVNKSAGNLNELICDILDFVEIGAEVFEPNIRKIEVGLILSDLRIFLMRHIEQENKFLELHIKLRHGVPKQVSTDQVQLNRILMHLGMNAVKFSETGDINITLSGEQLGDLDYLRFDVQDFGIGIAPEYHQSVFEAFSQVDETMAREFEGSGLGLAICKQLVTILGGEIGVESEVGRGSTFWIRIPVQP